MQREAGREGRTEMRWTFEKRPALTFSPTERGGSSGAHRRGLRFGRKDLDRIEYFV